MLTYYYDRKIYINAFIYSIVVFVGIIVILFIISLFLPTEYTVERSIIINSEPQEAFRYVNNLNYWQNWVIWNKKNDPTVEFIYKGPMSGVGAVQILKGEQIDNRKLELTNVIRDKLIEYKLMTEKNKYIMTGRFDFEKKNGKTKAIWSSYTRIGGNPLEKYFGLLMDKYVGSDIEEGLKNLKELVEKKTHL